MDYDDNFYPGEVITVEADQAKVRFMAPIKRKSGKNNYHAIYIGFGLVSMTFKI